MTYLTNPHRFGGGGGPWTYASLSAAESSGDGWSNGDQINITGGATFLYYSALDTNGHSGLIHKNPYNDANVISTVTLRDAEGSGTDPDSWTGTGWDTSLSITTSGTDFEFDTTGGRSRIRKLTAGGRAMVINTDYETADTEFFVCLRNAKIVTTAATEGERAFWMYAYANIDGTDRAYAWITVEPYDSSYWGVTYDNANIDWSTKSYGTETDLWLYVKDGSAYFWLDDDSAPMNVITGTGTTQRSTNMGAGLGGQSFTSDLTFSTILTAGFSAS